MSNPARAAIGSNNSRAQRILCDLPMLAMAMRALEIPMPPLQTGTIDVPFLVELCKRSLAYAAALLGLFAALRVAQRPLVRALLGREPDGVARDRFAMKSVSLAHSLLVGPAAAVALFSEPAMAPLTQAALALDASRASALAWEFVGATSASAVALTPVTVAFFVYELALVSKWEPVSVGLTVTHHGRFSASAPKQRARGARVARARARVRAPPRASLSSLGVRRARGPLIARRADSAPRARAPRSLQCSRSRCGRTGSRAARATSTCSCGSATSSRRRSSSCGG